MRVAAFLLCLLGAASARMFSNGNEDSAEVFYECEACATSIDDLAAAITDPSRRSDLKGVIKNMVCRGLPVFQTDCVEIVNNDEKLDRFIRVHIRNLKSVCGCDGDGRCRQNAWHGTEVLQLMADRFRMSLTDSSTSCNGCKSTVNELWSLLGNEFALIELKGYAKSMCTELWNVRLAFFPSDLIDVGPYDSVIPEAIGLIMHMIPPTDINWCSEGIDQHWSEIIELVRRTIESSRVDQFCTEIHACRWNDRDQSNWRNANSIANRRYRTEASSRFYRGVERFTDNTVRDYPAICVLCELSQDRMAQTSTRSLMADFIHHAQNGHVDEGCAAIGAGIGLSADDEKIANCRRQVNNVYIPQIFQEYGKTIKRIYANIFPSSCSHMCTAQQVTDLEAMSLSEKQEFHCETCRSEISAAKELFQQPLFRKGLTDNTVPECRTYRNYAIYQMCEALADKYLPDYYGKLAEHMNADHVCAAMNLCPSVNSFSSSDSDSNESSRDDNET